MPLLFLPLAIPIVVGGVGASLAGSSGKYLGFLALYDAIFVKPSLAIGRFFWKKGDEATIDGLGPDNLAARAQDMAGVLMRFQSGYLYHYAFAMLAGVAALVTYFMFVR